MEDVVNLFISSLKNDFPNWEISDWGTLVNKDRDVQISFTTFTVSLGRIHNVNVFLHPILFFRLFKARNEFLEKTAKILLDKKNEQIQELSAHMFEEADLPEDTPTQEVWDQAFQWGFIYGKKKR